MDFPNLGEEPRAKSPGEREQELAGLVIMAARLFLSLELDRNAVATLISNLSAKWPVLKQVARAVVEGMEG